MSDTRTQFTDRYQAVGIPYPNPATMCHGQCDGVGTYPTQAGDTDDALWQAAHRRTHSLRSRIATAWKHRDVAWLFHRCDGWHFITCPDCNGTGLASAPTDTQRLDWWFAHGMDDSVCEGSVDLWWATEFDGDATTVVTHGTSLRDTLDKAMRGIYEPQEPPAAPQRGT